MNWITIEQVLRDHDKIVKLTGGDNAIRDLGVIDSAIKAPLQTFGGQDLFPTIVEKAARLGYGLAANHGFIDGNKRIGALSLLKILAINNIEIKYTQAELEEIFLRVADDKCDYDQLLKWVKQHLIK